MGHLSPFKFVGYLRLRAGVTQERGCRRDKITQSAIQDLGNLDARMQQKSLSAVLKVGN